MRDALKTNIMGDGIPWTSATMSAMTKGAEFLKFQSTQGMNPQLGKDMHKLLTKDIDPKKKAIHIARDTQNDERDITGSHPVLRASPNH